MLTIYWHSRLIKGLLLIDYSGLMQKTPFISGKMFEINLNTRLAKIRLKNFFPCPTDVTLSCMPSCLTEAPLDSRLGRRCIQIRIAMHGPRIHRESINREIEFGVP
jgi:hypothetical protein